MRNLMPYLSALLFVIAVYFYLSSTNEEKAYQVALSNFTYVDDIADEHKAFTRIDMPFSGDCEDFAFTLQLQIDGDVWAVSRDGDVDHAVLVTDGYVYDSLKTRPVKVENYKNRLIYVMTPPEQTWPN